MRFITYFIFLLCLMGTSNTYSLQQLKKPSIPAPPKLPVPPSPEVVLQKIKNSLFETFTKKINMPGNLQDTQLVSSIRTAITETVEQQTKDVISTIKNLPVNILLANPINTVITGLQNRLQPIEYTMTSIGTILFNNPYIASTASVDTLGLMDFNPNEVFIEDIRKTNAQEVLKQFIHRDPRYVSVSVKDLNVMAVCSGGGVRATLGVAGFMHALQKLNLLESVTAASALSGGAWYLSSWIASGLTPEEFVTEMQPTFKTWSLDGLKNIASENLFSPKQHFAIAGLVAAKLLSNQFVDWVDFYGAWLASHLLTDALQKSKINEFKYKNPQTFALGDLQLAVKSGKVPYPIFQSLNSTEKGKNYIEFTPDTVTEVNINSSLKNLSISTWSFGRKFTNLSTGPKHLGPVQSLGFIQGIWSAEPANRDVPVFQKIGTYFNKILPKKFVPYALEKGQIPPARVFSFSGGDSLNLMDSGSNRHGYKGNNLPYFSIARRLPDVIFVVDNGDSNNTPDFRGLFASDNPLENETGLLNALGYNVGELIVSTEDEIKDTYEIYAKKKYGNVRSLTMVEKIDALYDFIEKTGHKVIPRVNLEYIPVTYFITTKKNGSNGATIIYVPLYHFDPRNPTPINGIQYSDERADELPTMKFSRTEKEYNTNTKTILYNLLKNEHVIREALVKATQAK